MCCGPAHQWNHRPNRPRFGFDGFIGGLGGTNIIYPVQPNSPTGDTGAAGLGLDVAGNFTSQGFNLIGTGDSSTGFANGINADQIGNDAIPIDPMLGPVQNNGGTTPTQALLWSSPAIDQGYSFGIRTDQLGNPRPRDYSFITNATGGDGSDIGAFELSEVLRDRLTVNTNGAGIILPNDNGALLVIDSSYTLTAITKPGFAFTNWTDGNGIISTNKPALRFMMASNLVFTANFVDIVRPTLSIITFCPADR